MTWERWSVAWERALYGDGGFFVRGEEPARHFRTSAHVGDVLVRAVLDLLDDVDAALGHPAQLDLVDVGAGGGELLVGVADLADEAVRSRLVLAGVDRAPRPADLPAEIGWTNQVPHGILGLVLGNEWLDNVPCAIVEKDADGRIREVEVDPSTGTERLGPDAIVGDDIWCSLWWPLAPGQRAEVGRTRDRAWAEVVTRVDYGLAVAIDYAHNRLDRRSTLTGYREGRQVLPVPDGTCDITAHVALDSCASAGEDVARTPPIVVSQREILRAYAVTGQLPPVVLVSQDAAAYAMGVQRANLEAEMLDPSGLGAFGWLLQPIGVPMPPRLAALRAAR